MTISSQTSRIEYTGSGSTTVFSVPFYFAANADLAVYLRDTAGVATLQVLGTQYNLTGATVNAGGSCTFVTAPPAGYTVVIFRDPARTQTTSYNNNDPFPAASHELALDKALTIDQRNYDLVTRTLRLSDGDSTATMTIPSSASRLGKLAGYDAAGLPTVSQNSVSDVDAFVTNALLTGPGGFLQSGTGAVSRSWQTKLRDTVNVKDFGAAGDGVANDAPAIQLAIDALYSASAGGVIDFNPGTYRITSSLKMRPGIVFQGRPGTIIKQGNSANILLMIDFTTNAADGAGIRGCVIDGNRANNTDDTAQAGVATLAIYTANDVLIENCTIQNGNGLSFYVTSGVRPIIRRNTFQNFYGTGGIVSSTIQAQTFGSIVENTFLSPIGAGAVFLSQTDWNLVARNKIIGTQVLSVVTTAGTAVTYVSGTNFANVTAGQFLTLVGGQEFLIASKVSNTALTLASTAGVQTSVTSVAGPGDLISVNAASFNIISDNRIQTGGAGGITLFNNGTENTQKNTIKGNTISAMAQEGIAISGAGSANPIFGNAIIGNTINNCGQGLTAVASVTRAGITLINSNTAYTWVDGNMIYDSNGTPMLYWMDVSGLSAGTVYVGQNFQRGCTNNGINGGISVVLSSGWGSTASATTISNGSSFKIVVTPGGTGIAANPTITVTTVATTAAQPPYMVTKAINFSGAINDVFGAEFSPAATGMTLTYVATPVSGTAVHIVVK